jgi:hypothetical protein
MQIMNGKMDNPTLARIAVAVVAPTNIRPNKVRGGTMRSKTRLSKFKSLRQMADAARDAPLDSINLICPCSQR